MLRIRVFIPDPGFWFLPIPDPGSKNSNKREGWKKICSQTFYVATNFTKLKIIFVLKCWKKKFGPIFKELKNFLPKKFSLSSQKYGFGIRDPRSGIRKKTYSGSRIQGSKRHRIPVDFFRAKIWSFCSSDIRNFKQIQYKASYGLLWGLIFLPFLWFNRVNWICIQMRI